VLQCDNSIHTPSLDLPPPDQIVVVAESLLQFQKSHLDLELKTERMVIPYNSHTYDCMTIYVNGF